MGRTVYQLKGLLLIECRKPKSVVINCDQGPVAQKFRKNQTQVKIKRKIKRNLRSIINRVAQNIKIKRNLRLISYCQTQNNECERGYCIVT